MASLFRKKRTSSSPDKKDNPVPKTVVMSDDKHKSEGVKESSSPEKKDEEDGGIAEAIASIPVRAKGFFSRAPTIVGIHLSSGESDRLKEDKVRKSNWKRWGPYLSERQWATVREDYSSDGSW